MPPKPSLDLKPIRLRRLSNAEYEQAERLANLSGIPLDQCPTCLSRLVTLPDGTYGRENGTYRYAGEDRACDCDTQISLRKHYLLAGIGDQYMRLDWEKDYRDEDIKTDVGTYLESWANFKLQGMGVEFSSPALGVGKTFAATHVGKELIKRGERVYFTPFLEIIGLYDKEESERRELEHRLKEISVLILDEVVPPYTEAQGKLFSSKFEEIIRDRTNFNRVTIMTTNLTPVRLLEHYPRPYSLLAAKQCRIEMTGEDARQSIVKTRNISMIANNEIAPIT